MTKCCRLSGALAESDVSDSTESYSECECGVQHWRPSCACVTSFTPDKCVCTSTTRCAPAPKPGVIEILTSKVQELYNTIHGTFWKKHSCVCGNNYAYKKPCECGVRRLQSSCACDASLAPPDKCYNCTHVCSCSTPPPKPGLLEILISQVDTLCDNIREFFWKQYCCGCEDEFYWTLFKSTVWFLIGLKLFNDLAKYIKCCDRRNRKRK